MRTGWCPPYPPLCPWGPSQSLACSGCAMSFHTVCRERWVVTGHRELMMELGSPTPLLLPRRELVLRKVEGCFCSHSHPLPRHHSPSTWQQTTPFLPAFLTSHLEVKEWVTDDRFHRWVQVPRTGARPLFIRMPSVPSVMRTSCLLRKGKFQGGGRLEAGRASPNFLLQACASEFCSSCGNSDQLPGSLA